MNDINEIKTMIFQEWNKLERVDRNKFLQDVSLKNYILLSDDDKKNVEVCLKLLNILPNSYKYFSDDLFQNNDIIDKMVENIPNSSSERNAGFYIEKDYLKALVKNKIFKEHLLNIAEIVIVKEENNQCYIKIFNGSKKFKSMYRAYEEKRKMKEDLDSNKKLKKHKLVKF